MIKKLKVIIATIMIVSILIAMALPSFATITESTNTGTIKLTGIEAGVKVNIYQLTTVNYNYIANQPSDPEYEWKESVKTWVDANYSQFANTEDFYTAIETMSNEAQDFYDDLTNAIKSGKITLKASDTKTAEGTAEFPITQDKKTGEIEFTNVEMGTYLIIIENGYMVYRPSVVNVTPVFDTEAKTWKLIEQEVVIKATEPTITKTVTDGSKSKDNYSSKDIISYEILADIPKYLEKSLSKNYYIADKLDNSISLDKSSIKVYGVKGEEKTKLDIGYNIEFDEAMLGTEKTATYGITFDYDEIKAYDKIKIEYEATLNKNDSLKIGESGNNNVAYLKYSNNPYIANSLQTQNTEKVTVYTYAIKVTKVDKKDNTKTLAGAEFELLQNDQKLYFIKTAEGIYYLANESDQDATTTLIVNDNGVVQVNGLDEGTYKVKEILAPDGYNIATKTYNITLTDADVNGVLDDDNDGIASLLFPNTQSFQLPFSGGNGTTAYIMAGVILVVVGSSIIIILKTRKKEEK